jgi:S-adenosylmethionine:tRNA ribosyltransferase-isomerase
MSESLSDYFYELPEDLIASRPTENRADSRMLVVHRADGTVAHHQFREFPTFLRAGDIVALNNSKVIKARLRSEDGRIEIFLLERIRDRTWKCLTKPGRKARTGDSIPVAGTSATVLDVLEGGERIFRFETEPDLELHGAVPLPPYLKREADKTDDDRYQTVYAKHKGSVAAPTAGLHFTNEILAQIPHTFLTLHVGAGTFLPVKAEKIEDHAMHEETYSISEEAATDLNAAKRIVAVGTTVARVLESQPRGPLQARDGRTSIFIHPPFEFAHTGALLTNFHLPCSTLLMLVSALAGRELIRHAYDIAVRERYRFFSYGDCMLIV